MDQIPLSIPEIRGNEWTYVKECLDTGWVSSVGAYVERFERDLAGRIGAPYAVATTSGTAALHTALLVAGVQPDDDVLVSTLTFIAPANAIRYTGAWPVFIDAEPEYWQMDPRKVAEFLKDGCNWKNGKLVNKSTNRPVTAILPVHVLGHPVDLGPLLEIAREYGLKVIEDCAESLGAAYRTTDYRLQTTDSAAPVPPLKPGRESRVAGQRPAHAETRNPKPSAERWVATGALGDIACFSFNGNKIITAGGGGMIITGNEEWADRARYLSTQAKDDPVEYVHGAIGYNYRLTNIQAAVGVAQLEMLDEYVGKKRDIARRYEAAFAEVPGLSCMKCAPWAESTYWLYTVLVDEETYGLSSRRLLQGLGDRGIQSRPVWRPVHLNPPYAAVHAHCPVSERLNRDALSLPSSVGLTPEQQDAVIRAVKDLAGTA